MFSSGDGRWMVFLQDAAIAPPCRPKLLLTDTPAPGAIDDAHIAKALQVWAERMDPKGTMYVFSHLGPVIKTAPNVIYKPHAEYVYGDHFDPTLSETIIKAYTKPGDLVVDPFCGNSTTGVAALNLGRLYVGLDIDPHRVALSVEALEPVVPAPDGA